MALLALKMINYVSPHELRLDAMASRSQSIVDGIRGWYGNEPLFHSCESMVKVRVPGGYVCGNPGIDDEFARIFRSSPISGGAREAVYPSLLKSDRPAADAMLSWRVSVPRYADFQGRQGMDWASIDNGGTYWRFYFYGFRTSIPLVDAYVDTGDVRYLTALWALDDSFTTRTASKKLMWADEHAVAFRVMSMTYQWWKLRELHVLDQGRAGLLLAQIKADAEFLADKNHYQSNHNHGTNEAAALLLVAAAYPDLSGSKEWLTLATERLTSGADDLIDDDGVLIENSPYYHFYELEKFWQIQKFSRSVGVELGEAFAGKVVKMINFAAHVLHPDGSIPLLGASLERTFVDNGTFAEIADEYPEFKYVVTRGASGAPPTESSVYFENAGQTIFRSAWGDAQHFGEATYSSFNVGEYRTTHSQLDSLGLTLYGDGRELLPAPGLYSYTESPMRDYFRGTSSHNAVTVDGADQAPGRATAGPLVQQDGVTSQSASTNAYPGVTNIRTVIMADAHHLVVLDDLSGATRHTYQQNWHLFSGARVVRTTSGVAAFDQEGRQAVAISQLGSTSSDVSVVSGQEKPKAAGLCSRQYEVAIACPEVSFGTVGKATSFVTLLTIGADESSFAVSYNQDAGVLDVSSGGEHKRISIQRVRGSAMSVSSSPPSQGGTSVRRISALSATGEWSGGSGFSVVGGDLSGGAEPSVQIQTGGPTVQASVHTKSEDLSTGNLQVRLRLTSMSALSWAKLRLLGESTDDYCEIALTEIYDRRWDGEWVTLAIPRNARREHSAGSWLASGRFDWARVMGAQISLNGNGSGGDDPGFSLSWIGVSPAEAEASVAFVFDDGYDSILPAADYLHGNGFVGNVAAISKYLEHPSRGHLSVVQLRHLQDDYGWNVANHTQQHVNAYDTYSQTGELAEYAADILAGQQFLAKEGLDSAPNWFVYPNGAVDAALESVVRKYYTFARVTLPGSDAYPFGSPLRIRTLEVHNPGDVREQSAGGLLTKPEVVEAALSDAKQNGSTLILTFHRIHATETDRPGYPLALFKEIVDYVKASGLGVRTFSQMDAARGVRVQDHITVLPETPDLRSVDVEVVSSGSGWTKFIDWVLRRSA